MEPQLPPQYVQQVQPNQTFQPTPNVVYVESPPPRQSVSGPAIGALVFSLCTLFCCPESFLCTIPSCICAIMAMNDKSDSSKNLSTLSFIFTGLFYIAFIIGMVVFLIWYFTVFIPNIRDTYHDYFDLDDIQNGDKVSTFK